VSWSPRARPWLLRLGALVLALAGLELLLRAFVPAPAQDRHRLWRVFGAEGYADRERSHLGLASIDALSPLLESDEALLWKLRPGLSLEGEALDPALGRDWSVRTSPEGHRARPLAELPEGERRIVALGGSGTFGWGVQEEEAWPARLEEALDEGAQVLNLGVPGYTAAQSRRHLVGWAAQAQPEVVILTVGDSEARLAPRTDLEALSPGLSLPRSRALRLLRHRLAGPWAEGLLFAARLRLLEARLPVEDFERELSALALLAPRTILVDLCAPIAWRASLAELARVRRDLELVRYGAAHGETIDGCLPTPAGHAALAVRLAERLYE
jgi:hypothetical protein